MNSTDKDELFIQPTEKELENIFKEICMNENDLREKTNSIREWIPSQRHLPQSLGDEDIKPFLVWAKGDLAECQKRLDSFYSMRSHNTKLFNPRDPLGDDFKASYSCSNVVILPRQYEGCSVLMTTPTTEDPSSFTVEGLARRMTLILELSMRLRPMNSGYCIIMDEKFVNIGHIPKLSPSVIKECLYSIQNVLPLRLKLIIIINVRRIIKVVLETFVFPFLKKKILKRIHLYSEGHEALQKHFPKEILPSDYGGEERTLQQLDDSINSFLIARRDYILKENSLKTDETLRIGEDPFPKSNQCSLM